jgi:uncharacterized spore protein YtfJ
MDVQEMLSQAKDEMSVRHVYGEPYEHDGTVVIPAARVRGFGGGGGGEGSQPGNGTGSGSGLGFGLHARPVGAYMIRSGELVWKPAIDVTSVALRAQAALILVLLLVLRRHDR